MIFIFPSENEFKNSKNHRFPERRLYNQEREPQNKRERKRRQDMLMNRLNEQLYMTSHTDIDHIIAKFIKQNLDDIGKMSIEEVATCCFVSKGKISKFCRSLGYESFIAFKDDCIKETQIKNKVITRTGENLELDYLIHLNHSLDTIYQNLSQLNLEKTNHLIEKIQRARQIYLYGVAYSNLLCKYIQYELDFLDKEVIIMDESLQKDYIHPDDSLLIVVSVGGNGLANNQRLFNRLMRYPVEKWILTTDRTNPALLKSFHSSLIIPAADADLKDQRFLLRYAIDVLLGRFQYLEHQKEAAQS